MSESVELVADEPGAQAGPSWSEALLALLICHLLGDFLLQTDWQAQHKSRGAGRALASHIATYTLVR